MSNWGDLKNNPRLKNIYDTRLEILRLTRKFFWSQDFKEVETPIALRHVGQEPYLNPMSLQFKDPFKNNYKFFLRTSPEYGLKKLLASGYEKIFEIGKCFRNGESFGGVHNPEFTMIEWYRSPGTYWDFMQDTEELFKYIGRELKIESLNFQGLKIDYSQVWDKMSVKELWQKYLNVNLDEYLEVDSIKELTLALGLQVDDGDRYEDLFYKIFLNKIENNLGIERPIFVYDYPAQMCSLSKLCENNRRYAQRAELYVGGLEIANGFGELTDSVMQKDNLQLDQNLRIKLNQEICPIDDDFINALESGIKPTGGIALGMDRMVLLFTGAHNLNEVIFQSAADQINL